MWVWKFPDGRSVDEVTAAIDDLAGAGRAVGDLIARVRPDQRELPTPCIEWNVHDVVQHLVAMNLVFTAMIGSGSMPERGADVLGDDPGAAYSDSMAALETAFGQPGVLERHYAGPLGTATGDERLRIRLYDLLAHGWDIASATSIPIEISDDIAERSLVFVRDQLSSASRGERFAEPQPVDGAAPALDRLAAFLGRSVTDAKRATCR